MKHHICDTYCYGSYSCDKAVGDTGIDCGGL